MKNSHLADSTRKGFNYGVWFGLIVNEKRGKQKSLNWNRIITNVADQNAWQEQPHNNHKVGYLVRQQNSAMKNCSALSYVNYKQPKQYTCHLTYICCLPAFTDENCRETSWQELNWGKCKSDSPCLMQRVWVQEWRQSQSNMNSWQ